MPKQLNGTPGKKPAAPSVRHRDEEWQPQRRSFSFGRDLLSLFASLRETDGDGLFSTLDRPASPA
jgi:hypothetical protein